MGTLDLVSRNVQYSMYKYTYGNKTYDNIHVFTTKPGTQSICPAISMKRTSLANMNPVMASPKDIIAKTNGNMFEYNKDLFYGFFYQGPDHELYIDMTRYESPDDIPSSCVMFTDWSPKYWPSFCVKNDGTAAIRWFSSKDALLGALPYCECVIASVHALVFDGKSVYNEDVYDQDGVLIYDRYGDNKDTSTRHNPNNGSPTFATGRTLLGHKAGNDGVYIMVCTNNSSSYPNSKMNCEVASNLMLDLGCDYAVNMDGGSPLEMRIIDGYGANGRGTVNSYTAPLFTAVCAYLR